MKKTFWILLCCVFAWTVEAQETTAIAGTIIDKSTRLPVAYADVFIENTNVGTISNEDGMFILNVPSEFLKRPVRITHLGYATCMTSLPQLDSLNHIIALDLSPKVLEEIVVRPKDPVAIAKMAFDRIKDNYSTNTTGLKAFYREYARENGKTVQLFEALLGISYSPYNGEKGKWGIKLLKGRKGNDPDTSRAFKFIRLNSVPDAMLFEDLVHKRYDFLNSVFAGSSDMTLADIVDFDGRQVYVIDFDQKEGVKKALFKGKMFIETKTLAIIRVEYSESPKGIAFDKFNKIEASASDNEPHVRLEGFKVVMNYKIKDSTWYLEDIVGDYEFHVTKKHRDVRKNIDSDLAIHGELLVTDVEQGSTAAIESYNATRTENWIFNKINNYDPKYWEHINYIVPSMKVKSIADTLNDVKQ